MEPWTLWLGLDQHGGRCPSVRRELDREGAKLEQRWQRLLGKGDKIICRIFKRGLSFMILFTIREPQKV